MIKSLLKNIGPGTLITAAFIGPGTVTVCTIAGVDFGFSLIWAIVLSIVATIVLQEMSARLGIVTQRGLAEAIRSQIHSPFLKAVAIVLILSAIVIGNAAYEAGNISGGVLGLEAIFGVKRLELGWFSLNYFSLAIGVIAFLLLYFGKYKAIERVLVILVLLMSVSFLMTAFITKPDITSIIKGFVPKLPNKSALTVIGLVGTTVVPYNLFLHAALVSKKWKDKKDLKYAKSDTILAVVLGGIVSIAIMISAAAIQTQDITNASDLALGLEPLFGSFAKYFLAVGLFAAGITSAITAPLAAAYVATGCLGWSSELRTKRFRAVWILILIIGVLSSSTGFKSIQIIKFAQVANGILLPIIAGFLIWIVNKSSVLGAFRNTKKQTVFALLILIITVFLGIKSILSVFN